MSLSENMEVAMPNRFLVLNSRKRRDCNAEKKGINTNKVLNSCVYPCGVRTKTLEQIQLNCGTTCISPRLRDNQSSPLKRNEVKRTKSIDAGSLNRPNRKVPIPDKPTSCRTEKREMKQTVWLSTQNKCAIPDARDSVYINTYCPDERPMRYNEITLPRIGKDRPCAATDRIPPVSTSFQEGRQLHHDGYHNKIAAYNGWVGSLPKTRYEKKSRVSKSLGLPCCEIKRIPLVDRLHDSNYYVNSATSPRYRPLRAEQGKYRPFSTISVKIPHMHLEMLNSPKMFVSVDQYIKYAETKSVMDTQMSPVHNTQQHYTTPYIRYHDPDNQAVQFVMSVNRPPSSREETQKLDSPHNPISKTEAEINSGSGKTPSPSTTTPSTTERRGNELNSSEKSE